MRATLAFGVKVREKKQPRKKCDLKYQGQKTPSQYGVHVYVRETDRQKRGRWQCQKTSPGPHVKLNTTFSPVTLKGYLSIVVGLNNLPFPYLLLFTSVFQFAQIWNGYLSVRIDSGKNMDGQKLCLSERESLPQPFICHCGKLLSTRQVNPARGSFFGVSPAVFLRVFIQSWSDS